MMFLKSLLRLFVESIHDMQEGIAGQYIGVCFSTTLGIHGTGNVVELAEEVEAIEHNK